MEDRARFRVALIASLLFAGLAALLVIPYPFSGDQALFAVFARMMDGGATLYVDVWDVKQPGIFWFYQVTGSAFGFSEIAAHAVEAAYLLVSSTVIALVLRPVFRRQWIAGLVPLGVPGLYLLAAGSEELTQIEALISPLIFFVVWLLLPHDNGNLGRWRSVVAGLLTGVIMVFKLLALVVPVAILAVAVVIHLKGGRSVGIIARRVLLPFLAGVAIPLAILLGWVVVNDLMPVVWFTWFEYPPQVLGLEPRPLSRLLTSVLFFSAGYASIGLLALVRVIRPSSRARSLSFLLMAALGGGVLLVVLQLWWAYLFYVLIAPLTVLGLQGLDDLLEKPPKIWVPVAAAALLVAFPAFVDGATKVQQAAGLVRGESLDDYRVFSYGYGVAKSEASLIAVEAGTPVYVLGNPLLLYVLDADQSIPINGWSPQFWTQDLWREVADDLASDDTAALYIENSSLELSRERAPWFEEEMSKIFRAYAEGNLGSWLLPRPG